jgi:predicted dehydrogenase
MIVPRHVLGRGYQAPSDTLNVATVGVGGMGGSNTQALMSQNIVALCDCDDAMVDARIERWRRSLEPRPPRDRREDDEPSPYPVFDDYGPSRLQQEADARWTPTDERADLVRFLDEQLPRARRYRDYREMLEQQSDIDAVVVATPDHMHAVIASAAMDLGKHVYVQKPLCWSVHEARHLARRAAETGVVTQMGNQGHSADSARRGQDYLRAGAIGDVTDVHVWTNRPLGYWPQGVPRPQAEDIADLGWNNRALMERLANSMSGDYPVPDTLSWDLFLGVSPDVDYHPVYHPFNWRGWVDWGQGALGDMGAHILDHPVWALELGLPTVIETLSTPFDGVCYPHATTTYFEFPERGARPPVKMTWYDGGLLPPRPDELGEEPLNGDGGVLLIGTDGKMLQDTYGGNPRLLPAERHNAYGPPPESVRRVPHQEHEMNWVNAIKGTDEVSCPFSFAAVLTEIMLLGIVSLRADNAKLHYDPAAMRVTNYDDANPYLTREYRAGYAL